MIVHREAYPYPTDLPEGRWEVYNVTLPNKPTHTVEVAFQSLTTKLNLIPDIMVFEPHEWDTPQQLVVYAVEDTLNEPSPYSASFNMSLSSGDKNFNHAPVPNYNLTVEDNDEGRRHPRSEVVLCLNCFFFCYLAKMKLFFRVHLYGRKPQLIILVRQHSSHLPSLSRSSTTQILPLGAQSTCLGTSCLVMRRRWIRS